MSLASPGWLALLALVPLALVALAASRARARRYAVRFTALPALAAAAGREPAWRRHVPAALALAAVAALAVALARPHATVAVPFERASIVLVTDHSRSMRADDVRPTRLEAAVDAAHDLIDELPSEARVGVVAYSGTPDAVQTPSIDHEAARAVIDDLIADGATATGDALEVATEALRDLDGERRRPPAAIVLLSDGKTTTGRDPVAVAQEAGRLDIPVHTVALGTDFATVPNPDPFGPPLPVEPDPETLELIAEASGGRAFKAQGAAELSSIYRDLGSRLGRRDEEREISAAFAAGALLLLLGAGVASLRRAGRLP